MTSNNWITENWNALKNKPLNAICFPGTHDSFTYDLQMKLGPDATSAVSGICNFIQPLRPYIKRMATAQKLNYQDQINIGIRYFDARIALDGETLCFTHSLYSNTKVQDILDQTATFLGDKSNTKEIIVWKVDFEGDANQAAAAKAAFQKLLSSAFALSDEKLNANWIQCQQASQNFCTQTLASLNTSGDRFVLIDSGLIDSIYNQSNVTVSAVISEIEKESINGSKIPFEPQCILPISTKDYILGGLQYLAQTSSGILVYAALAVLVGLAVYSLGNTTLAIVFGLAIFAAYYYFKAANYPTSIQDVHALNGYKIFDDYYSYISKNIPSAQKAMLMIVNFPPTNYINRCLSITSKD